jgi:heterodisulfide reductase subunit B
LRQADARKADAALPETPVLYITQLLGLALELSAGELGLDALSVPADSLFSASEMPLAAAARGAS